MNTNTIVHSVILLAVMVAAVVLAIRGLIAGDLAIGVVVAAAGIASPSPFASAVTTAGVGDPATAAGLSSGA